MEYLIIAFIGACLGSFVTAASYRLPRNEDIIFDKSRCPACRQALGPRDLVPILSWLWNRAKCSMCKAKISPRYLMTEIIMLLIAVGLFNRFGLTLEFGLFLALATFLMILIVADFETYIMPDSATIGALIVGIAYVYYLQPYWLENIIGAGVGLIIALGLKYGYFLFTKKEGLGMGDVKFLPVAGLWIGFSLLPLYLVTAGLLGIITALFWKLLYKNPVFPFGPALAAAMFIICVFKDTVRNIIQL
jgi:prepilin signal peptidase PulO-like enzyme (type II secretory pathway)